MLARSIILRDSSRQFGSMRRRRPPVSTVWSGSEALVGGALRWRSLLRGAGRETVAYKRVMLSSRFEEERET